MQLHHQADPLVHLGPVGKGQVRCADASTRAGFAKLQKQASELADTFRDHNTALQQNPETVAETPGWPLSINVVEVRAVFPSPPGKACAHWCHHKSLKVAEQPSAPLVHHNADLLLQACRGASRTHKSHTHSCKLDPLINCCWLWFAKAMTCAGWQVKEAAALRVGLQHKAPAPEATSLSTLIDLLTVSWLCPSLVGHSK